MGDEIEVGANGDELSYWQFKEAMRQAELRLNSQATTLQAYEARATSILGWLVAILTTVAGGAVVALNNGSLPKAGAICAVLIPAGITAFSASRVVWPKKWFVPGYEPSVVTSQCENELQQIMALVEGYANGITENARFLASAAKYIRLAWWGLLLMPITGIGAALITWALKEWAAVVV